MSSQFSFANLLLGVLFGGIGGVYVALGRKEHDALYLTCGVALILYSWIFESIAAIVLIGAAIAAIPVARHRGWF